MTNSAKSNAEPVALGALRGSYGLKGWVKIQPFQDGFVLLETDHWVQMNREGVLKPLEVEDCKVHGKNLIAKIKGIETPEDAALLKGAVGVYRENFPEPEEGEFYWIDLIGCTVVNTKDEKLGKVQGMDSNGAQDILEVAGEGGKYLIPFVESYILEVSIPEKTIRVDWEKDWT